MFKIFDFDNDGLLNRSDLEKGLGLLLEGSLLGETSIDRIVDKILEESDTKNKDGIDFEGNL